ncbi:MAG: SH3 domain-containing protein [Chloroflexota bacterium]|nr:SH3 domain-containing protein [Chloroflexota bacterium]
MRAPTRASERAVDQVYQSDDGENPGLFTVVGILVTLLLGVGVFFLLYGALSAPGSASAGVLPPLVIETPPQTEITPEPAPTAPATATSTQVVTIRATAPPTKPASTEPPTSTPTTTIARATRTPTSRPVPSRIITLRVASNGLGLNVRRLPSLNSGIIERLPDGSRVRDLGQTRRIEGVQWRRVRTGSGANGWASADVLQPAR